MPEFAARLGVRTRAHSYWDAYTPEIIKKYMTSGKAPGYAGSSRYCASGIHSRRSIEEEFARDARLAATAKGEAMIEIAIDWTAGQLRWLIEEA